LPARDKRNRLTGEPMHLILVRNVWDSEEINYFGGFVG